MARLSGAGDLDFSGEGITTFTAENTYIGDTNILEGTLRVTGTLSDSTAVSVSEGATYDVDKTDTIGSIAGAGSIQIATGETLTAGGLNADTEV